MRGGERQTAMEALALVAREMTADSNPVVHQGSLASVRWGVPGRWKLRIVRGRWQCRSPRPWSTDSCDARRLRQPVAGVRGVHLTVAGPRSPGRPSPVAGRRSRSPDAGAGRPTPGAGRRSQSPDARRRSPNSQPNPIHQPGIALCRDPSSTSAMPATGLAPVRRLRQPGRQPKSGRHPVRLAAFLRRARWPQPVLVQFPSLGVKELAKTGQERNGGRS
jgi:hypothetical protein